MSETTTVGTQPQTSPISLSAAAATAIRKVVGEESGKGAFTADKVKLRVGVRGGGCSGFSYTLDLTEDEKGETDEELESHGIKILVDMKSLLYLQGTEIDYRDDGMMQQGFLFKNPNATSTCGCGSSFQA
jgi:iron-sulfur cluster assembly protein